MKVQNPDSHTATLTCTNRFTAALAQAEQTDATSPREIKGLAEAVIRLWSEQVLLSLREDGVESPRQSLCVLLSAMMPELHQQMQRCETLRRHKEATFYRHVLSVSGNAVIRALKGFDWVVPEGT